MSRLGVFGGSFNPVHWGHLHAALLAREARELDRVLFVPAASPPHKPSWELAPGPDRWEMLVRALREEEEVELSDVELAPGGPRYTADTLERLGARHPGAELHFILGMDSLAEIPTWKDPERLLGLCQLIAVNRPGTAPPPLDPRWQDRVSLVEGNPFAIASSEIRARVAGNRTIRHLVPEPVARCIEERGLYRREDPFGSGARR